MSDVQELHPLAGAALGEQTWDSAEAEVKRLGRPRGTVIDMPAAEPPEDDLLFNDYSKPMGLRKAEQPRHRLIIYLKASGLSNIEVADKMHCSPVTVGQVLAQPWAKERLAKELADAGKDQVEAAVKGAALDSVQTLVEIRDSGKASANARVAAANSLLDRFLGKATQRVEVTPIAPPPTDLVELEAQLVELRAKQAQLSAPPSRGAEGGANPFVVSDEPL